MGAGQGPWRGWSRPLGLINALRALDKVGGEQLCAGWGSLELAPGLSLYCQLCPCGHLWARGWAQDPPLPESWPEGAGWGHRTCWWGTR